MGPLVSLVLEGLVVLLLGVTIFYCLLLDRRLRALRSGQDGLRQVIEGLDAATARAQHSIRELRKAGDEVSENLGGNIAKARSLADELELMIDSGERLAARLEGGRASRRPGTSSGPSASGLPTGGEAKGTGQAAGLQDRLAEEYGDAPGAKLLKALREAR